VGSPNADGNSFRVEMPPTEHVKGRLLRMSISRFFGVKDPDDWKALLRDVFSVMYPDDPRQLESAVQTSLVRIKNGYFPSLIVNQYRQNTLNRR